MSWFEDIEKTLFVSLVLLVMYLAYTLLLKMWERGKVMNNVELDNMETPYGVSGTLDFHFQVNNKTQIDFSILEIDESHIDTLANKIFDSGDYTLSFDCSRLKDGWYWYRLKMPKQCITRRFKVDHSK